jgi:hypothetical protein
MDVRAVVSVPLEHLVVNGAGVDMHVLRERGRADGEQQN